MPFQCLRRYGNVLFAASTSHLDTFNLATGSRIARWSCPTTGSRDGSRFKTSEPPNLDSQKSETSSIDIVLESEPPAKKRRLSKGEDEVSNVQQKAPRHKAPKPSKAPVAPNVVILACTTDGQHVIAVTGEDKTIRVLEHDGEGLLKQLSARAMLKRPCAIAVTSDNSTIVCADKFGDVYSLPLLMDPEYVHSTKSTVEVSDAIKSTEAKMMTPSANTLTIHTQRNRKALEQQQKQLVRHPDKQELKFEHKLLLGHVSMLTDVACVSRGSRSHIITADRDEHIRVSRGIPQAHIIENYCLGHKEFISRICLPVSIPSILISGGGEDELYVWNWEAGVLLGKGNLRSHLSIDADTKVVVSGIHDLGNVGGDTSSHVAVICESFPTIFIFSVSPDGEIKHVQTLSLAGNAIDIAPDTSTGDLIVSIDLIHEPGSSTTIMADAPSSKASILAYSRTATTGLWESGSVAFEAEEERLHDPSAVSALLYGLGNLRKRAGEDEE